MRYDLAVIGGGPGGYTAAAAAAQAGLQVVLFEKDELGGTCLNRGCIPTKAMLHTAEVWSEMQQADTMGLHAEGLAFDWAAVLARRSAAVDTLRHGVEQLMKTGGVTVVSGTAVVTGEGTVQCGEVCYEAADIVIAAGAAPALPPIPGRDLPSVCTSDDLLEGESSRPASLVIIGGGVIGVELAGAYSAFGCQVTIVEAMDRLLPGMDRELGQRLAAQFKKQGVGVAVKSSVQEITREGDLLTVTYTDARGNTASVTAGKVLIATGRRPHAEALFSGEYRPAFSRGGIVADEAGRTALPHLYVIGDAKAGNIQLAHLAEAQGKNVVAAILGKPLPVDTALVPSCIYTNPEIASIGMSEQQAKEAGLAVCCGKALSGANGRCVIAGCGAGFVKLVCEAGSGRLLGAQLCWPRATDLISELALAIRQHLTAAELTGLIHPHPTFSEGVQEAAWQVLHRLDASHR